MNNQDPLDILRDANPNPASDASEPQPRMGFDAHLQEIMMTTTTTPNNLGQPSLPRKWLPRTVLPLAGAAALITGLTVAGPFGSTTPAYAQVQAAAESSSEYDSGKILIEIDFDVLEEEPELEGKTGTHLYRFDGDRSHLQTDFAGERSEIIEVGDDVFHQGYEFFDDVDVSDKYILSENSVTDGALSQVINPDTSKPEKVLPLLKKTDDFKQTSSEGNTDVFSGTVTSSELAKLDADDVPAGLSLLVREDEAANLPETVDVKVVVEDKELSQLTIEVEGETAEGDIDATITTTFSNFGEPQEIVAPPADQVINEDELFPEDLEDLTQAEIEAIEILEEFDRSNPEVCKAEREAVEGVDPAAKDAQEQNDKLAQVWLTCIESEADSDVIEAARLLLQN